jgi:hypothetical protein
MRRFAAREVCRKVRGEIMSIHKLKWSWCLKTTKNGLYSDGGNLYLQVANDGAAKSWIFRYVDRRTQKQIPMGLGSIHAMDLNQARELAGTYRNQIAQGKDPKTERDGAKVTLRLRRGQRPCARFGTSSCRRCSSTRRIHAMRT